MNLKRQTRRLDIIKSKDKTPRPMRTEAEPFPESLFHDTSNWTETDHENYAKEILDFIKQ